MYYLLTTEELTVLQSMLYEATEETFHAASILTGHPVWTESYHPLHQEVAQLFIEAGTELLVRLDLRVPAA
jgi:hypothetical protein